MNRAAVSRAARISRASETPVRVTAAASAGESVGGSVWPGFEWPGVPVSVSTVDVGEKVGE